LASVCAFILLPAYAQKKPQLAPAKEAVKDIHSNSLNAPSIINIAKEIESQINAVKDDPFDPKYSEKIKASIYEKYTGKLFFIPMGDGEGSQKLAGLNYQVSDQKINIYPFDSDLNLAYYYRVDSDSCGAIKYRGYGVGTRTSLRNAGSDFATVNSENSSSGLSYSNINITNLSVDQARSLSGQIERYVTFKTIAYVSEQGNYHWTKGGSCSDIKLISTINGVFTYYYRDKNSGKSLLSFTVKD
jgi:hypothetical protein